MSSYQTLSSSMDIVSFWFSPEVQPFWFAKDNDFDEHLRQRFGHLYQDLLRTCDVNEIGEFKNAAEVLAWVIIFDQLPRNIFRNTPQAFATDEKALALSKAAIHQGLDKRLPTNEQISFLYLPFMHSEKLEDQEEGVRLFSSISQNDEAVSYAEQHRDIIKRFGRFPHRNEILGRSSTSEEVEFLKDFSGF